MKNHPQISSAIGLAILVSANLGAAPDPVRGRASLDEVNPVLKEPAQNALPTLFAGGRSDATSAEVAVRAPSAGAGLEDRQVNGYPARGSTTASNLIDLTRFYNVRLDQDFKEKDTNSPSGFKVFNLTALPRGVSRLGEAEYDLRGAVLLTSSELVKYHLDFPPMVEGIPLQQTCRRLHFLHAAAWTEAAGRPIGFYLLNYADGEQEVIPLLYGKDMSYCVVTTNRGVGTASVAWTGTNSSGVVLRLFHTAWQNPHPNTLIESMDLVSFDTKAAPLLVAITADSQTDSPEVSGVTPSPSEKEGSKKAAISPQDSAVTRELFVKWRSPRFGSANPERMNNPVWEWLVRSELSAYAATQRLRGPSALKAGPGWCFARFGQSSTQLPDGREVLIAGEHEDFYDPDFYIYNDVVVRHPNGSLDIYGYPREVFPPTDLHSATLVSNRIVIIGSSGYPKDSRPGQTPVRVLDLNTFAITEAKTSGMPPGWIHDHKAALSEEGASILVQGGKLDPGEDTPEIENIDDWRLRLADWRWERLTDRRWPQWEVRRKDGEMNHLLDYQFAVSARGNTQIERQLAQIKKQAGLPSLAEELGAPPDVETFAKLYQPSVVHEEASRPDEFNVHRIKIDGVVVRYVQGMLSIHVTVEGNLPQPTLDALAADLVMKLSKLERAPCEIIKADSVR
jgi:hypothetical protein